MMKLILLIIVGYVIYKLFWKKTPIMNENPNYDDNDLIECKICHTFVPKNECKFTSDGCICKDCQ